VKIGKDSIPSQIAASFIKSRSFPMMPSPSQALGRHRSIASYAFAIVVFCACSLILASSAFAQRNAITLPRNLGELVRESQVVVQGWVTGVTLEPHGQLKNLMTVVVTLQVEETLKGENLKTLVFRQAVIDKRDQQQYMGYRTGQHVLLVLISPSKFGLTSPAGLEQGRFHIEPLAAGKLGAANGFGNAGLFRGLNSQLQAKGIRVTSDVHEMITKPATGPVSLEHLKSLIRTIAASDSVK
jgi:hypothetical protein